jgi:hypothetical protein
MTILIYEKYIIRFLDKKNIQLYQKVITHKICIQVLKKQKTLTQNTIFTRNWN